MKPRRNLSRDCERWILRNSYLLLPLFFLLFSFSPSSIFHSRQPNEISSLLSREDTVFFLKSNLSPPRFERESRERERDSSDSIFIFPFQRLVRSVLFLPFPSWYLFNPWSKFPFSALTILARFRSRFPLNFYLESAPRHSIPHIGHD